MPLNPQTHLTDGRPRGRGLGLPFAGDPGPVNALTDVPGLEVGFTTLVSGEGPLVVGRGPVRTGVTVILPRGRNGGRTPVWAGSFALNGNGEMTGVHWIEESGQFEGPIAITNSHSVGTVHRALVGWLKRGPTGDLAAAPWVLPVVAETCDDYLNDLDGQHVTEAHVLAAIDGACGGPLAEGNVGGGTGMVCYEFKGGTGTASRIVCAGRSRYLVGALVQANHGVRPWLTIRGVPVGEHIVDGRLWPTEHGSVIGVVATDAPLLPTQLRRLARRASLGVGRTGTPAGNGSGDLFLAFSTANPEDGPGVGGLNCLRYLPHGQLDPLFEAVVDAVEEAVINALVAARTMTGRDDHTVLALDHHGLRDLMRRFGRLDA